MSDFALAVWQEASAADAEARRNIVWRALIATALAERRVVSYAQLPSDAEIEEWVLASRHNATTQWARWAGAVVKRPPETEGRKIAAPAFFDRLPFERIMALAARPEVQPFLVYLGTRKHYVDLDDPRVVQGIATLQAAGLIDASEVELLLADPRPDELP